MSKIKVVADDRVPPGELWAMQLVRRVLRVGLVDSYQRVARIVNIDTELRRATPPVSETP